MPKYNVTIEARVTKTLEIEADSPEDATIAAHEEFSACNDEQPERYVENVVKLEEV